MKLGDITPAQLRAAARQLRANDVATDLVALHAFAVAGPGGAGFVSVAPKLDRAMRRLYAGPGQVDFDPFEARLKPLSAIDEADAPGAAAVLTVVRAARGRLSLANADQITGPDLAVLLGCDESGIRRFARQGLLRRVGDAPRTKSPITGASARALLTARAIAGFGGAA